MTNPKTLPILQKFSSPGPTQGLFITFEGIEGCGKSTQIARAQKMLHESGHQVLGLREPGGTTFGEGLRQVILGQKSPLHPLAEAHLFCASRAQLLQEKIMPHLHRPQSVVLCDRYIDSSLAYQGMARGLGVETVLELHQHAPLNLLPQRTYYLKISVDESERRQQLRGNGKDYFEAQKREFHQRLVDGLDYLATLFPQRLLVIDGGRDVDSVWRDIERDLTSLLERH